METGIEKAEIHNLLFDLLADLHNVNVVWQVVVLAVSLAVAWWVARLVHARLMSVPSAEPSASLKIGVGGLNRVIFPLSALLCVILGRFVLQRFQHEVNLL